MAIKQIQEDAEAQGTPGLYEAEGSGVAKEATAHWEGGGIGSNSPSYLVDNVTGKILRTVMPEDFSLSSALKTIAPVLINAVVPGLGGFEGIGGSLGLGTGTAAAIGGGAAVGAGTAALTGQDPVKGAFLGGFNGAGTIGIGDTGVTVGQVNTGLKVLDNIQHDNLIAAITGAANLVGAGNTEIGGTGLTINDLSKDLNLAKAVISGHPEALAGALTSVANSVANSSNDVNTLINQYTQTGAGTGAATPNYPTNDVGFQQLVDELNKPPAATSPSVQVASNDNASALAALEDAKTAAKIDSGQTVDLGEVSNKPPDAELPPGLNFPGDQSTPTEAQQQQAISNLHDALAETQQPETPAETPITNPDALIGNLQDAGLTNDFISRNTPILGIGDPTDQISNPPLLSAEERALLAPQAQEPTVEQILASEPPPAETPTPIQDIIVQLQDAGLTNTEIKALVPEVEKFIAPEPAPAPAPEPAPEPKAAEIAPEVAQVIAEAEKTPTPEQTVEQILASEPPPAVSQVVPETLAPTPEERVLPPEQTIEQIMAAEPAVSQVAPEEPVTVPTQAEQQPAVENFIKQLEQYQAPEPTVEQILASEPPPAGVPAETPTPEVTPEVQALIDQAVTGQQESAQADQPAIDQQTQQLLSDLSGGTDTGVTPAETPRSIDNQIAADEQAKADAEAAQAETDKLAATHPDPVQALIDQVTNTDQPAIDQQTQDLLNELSGGTDNGVTSPIDYSGISDILSGGQTETPEEDIPTIDVTGKRPTDDSEPGWEGWTPPPTPIDYSGISDMLTGGQNETPPTEQAPAVSIPKIPSTTPAVAPVKTVTPVAKKPAAAPVVAAPVAAQTYMPSIGDVAHIKSLESLFGPILGTLLAEQTNEKQDDSLSALEGMDQEYASGGHVDDFSVEALLHILRS